MSASSRVTLAGSIELNSEAVPGLRFSSTRALMRFSFCAAAVLVPQFLARMPSAARWASSSARSCATMSSAAASAVARSSSRTISVTYGP